VSVCVLGLTLDTSIADDAALPNVSPFPSPRKGGGGGVQPSLRSTPTLGEPSPRSTQSHTHTLTHTHVPVALVNSSVSMGRQGGAGGEPGRFWKALLEAKFPSLDMASSHLVDPVHDHGRLLFVAHLMLHQPAMRCVCVCVCVYATYV
jgi:hypothetical protein